MVIEGGRSGLLGLTGSLPVFGDPLHPVVKYYGTPSFPFMFFCFFPLLKGANVTSQGVLHSQEQSAYLILFKSQTLQEISRITPNWDFLGSCLSAGGAVNCLFEIHQPRHTHLSKAVPARIKTVGENQQFCGDFHLDAISLLD